MPPSFDESAAYYESTKLLFFSWDFEDVTRVSLDFVLRTGVSGGQLVGGQFAFLTSLSPISLSSSEPL